MREGGSNGRGSRGKKEGKGRGRSNLGTISKQINLVQAEHGKKYVAVLQRGIMKRDLGTERRKPQF